MELNRQKMTGVPHQETQRNLLHLVRRCFAHAGAAFVNLSIALAGILLLAAAAPADPASTPSSQDPIYVFHTSLGDISVQLYPDVAPKTVANFLAYVGTGAYNNSIIHRSVPGFIFQGGGYQIQNGSTVAAIPTNSPVVNEFHLSNTRGTIAMAKLGSDPNSATSEWFFNESDSNASNLDTQNGGFTVFGKVADSASLAVMDQIAAVPVPSPPPLSAPFDQIPLVNYQAGTAVQINNLVQITSITLVPTVHVLWDNVSGAISVWNYAPAAGAFSQSTFGPYSGWTGQAIADGGTDRQTRVLWNKTDGTASIWSLNNTTGGFSQFAFGPYSGWTARDLSVADNNTTHVLWTNTDGTASLWNYDTTSGTFTQNNYGPYAGWTAVAVADGSDSKTRLLWTKSDGTAAIWSLDTIAGTFSQFSFGPYSGWTAKAISAGTGNTTHILWDNTNGTASVWNYNTTSGTFTQNSYGPYAGWTATGIEDGPDGRQVVLWNNTSGAASLWSLDNSTSLFSQFTFGPYSGWTAIGVSGD